MASPEGEENRLIIPAATETDVKILFVIKNITESLHIFIENNTLVHESNSSMPRSILLYNNGQQWRVAEFPFA